jgi:hypothetical protein
VILTAFAHMLALDAKTGKPVPKFGVDGGGRPDTRPAAAHQPHRLHDDLAAAESDGEIYNFADNE